MYAVIKTGGHQYRVKEGDTLHVEKIEGNPGDILRFSDVLMIARGEEAPVVGKPTIAGAVVEATIKEQTRDDKIIVFKYKRRKNYKKTQGHKQRKTVVEINSIKA